MWIRISQPFTCDREDPCAWRMLLWRVRLKASVGSGRPPPFTVGSWAKIASISVCSSLVSELQAERVERVGIREQREQQVLERYELVLILLRELEGLVQAGF
jgi:hypothetical protein